MARGDDMSALFAEDDNGLLAVPDLTDDIAKAILAGDDVDSDSTITETPQTATPGDTVECETCGRNVRVRKDGQLSSHKCEPKAQRGNRLDTLPDRRSPMPSRTRDFAVGVVAWAVEESTARMLARPFGVDPDDVPVELPDADVMVGVPLDMVWPEIPKAAQDFLGKLADNADVIDCGIAWWEWMTTVGKWARDQRHVTQQLATAMTPPEGQGFGTLLPFVAESD